MKKHLLTVLLTAAPIAAFAHDYTLGNLHIHHPWTRATPPTATNAAGYVTITNAGKTDDTLTTAAMEGAEDVMLHKSEQQKDMMMMKEMANGVVIPAGQTVTLQPAGLHIMAMKLSHPYTQGEMVKGSLTFQHAGTIPVDFKVEAMGAQSAPEEAMPATMHHMHGM